MDKAALIRKTGECTTRTDTLGRTVCRVKCQGCGEYIFSDDNLEEVEYVKTKRRSELFFHSRCMDDVWKHGIC
mgnify:CR=1 FL=1